MASKKENDVEKFVKALRKDADYAKCSSQYREFRRRAMTDWEKYGQLLNLFEGEEKIAYRAKKLLVQPLLATEKAMRTLPWQDRDGRQELIRTIAELLEDNADIFRNFEKVPAGSGRYGKNPVGEERETELTIICCIVDMIFAWTEGNCSDPNYGNTEQESALEAELQMTAMFADLMKDWNERGSEEFRSFYGSGAEEKIVSAVRDNLQVLFRDREQSLAVCLHPVTLATEKPYILDFCDRLTKAPETGSSDRPGNDGQTGVEMTEGARVGQPEEKQTEEKGEGFPIKLPAFLQHAGRKENSRDSVSDRKKYGRKENRDRNSDTDMYSRDGSRVSDKNNYGRKTEPISLVKKIVVVLALAVIAGGAGFFLGSAFNVSAVGMSRQIDELNSQASVLESSLAELESQNYVLVTNNQTLQSQVWELESMSESVEESLKAEESSAEESQAAEETSAEAATDQTDESNDESGVNGVGGEALPTSASSGTTAAAEGADNTSVRSPAGGDTAAEGSTGEVYIADTNRKIRSEKRKGKNVITVIPKGDTAELLETQDENGWIHVRYTWEEDGETETADGYILLT